MCLVVNKIREHRDRQDLIMALKVLDLCTGLGAFTVAGRAVGGFESVCGSEIDKFCCKHMEQNLKLENSGDVRYLATDEIPNSTQKYLDEDKVPAEWESFSQFTMADFMEGVVPWPNMVCAGSPCQNITSVNINGNALGIDGEKSKVIYDVMNVVENLEPEYVLLENGPLLTNKGLDVLLRKFGLLEYQVEWNVVSCACFGFPHYRHRLFIFAARKDSPIAKTHRSIFKLVSEDACYLPGEVVPTFNMYTQEQIDTLYLETPRSIKGRSLRINALGNSIVYPVAKSHMRAVKTLHFLECNSDTKCDFEDGVEIKIGTKIPDEGYMINGKIFKRPRDFRLNPKKTEFENMSSTLLRKDGNNNFNPSRLERPGKSGGVNTDLMRAFGFNGGGFHPEWAEAYMGYPQKFTDVNQ